MKNKAQKKQIKSARKVARKALQVRIVSALKTVTGQLGKESEKLAKKVEKESKKLAKQISKELDIKPAAVKTEPAKVVKTVKKPAPAKAPVTAAKKPIAKAAPVKTSTAKITAAKPAPVKKKPSK